MSIDFLIRGWYICKLISFQNNLHAISNMNSAKDLCEREITFFQYLNISNIHLVAQSSLMPEKLQPLKTSNINWYFNSNSHISQIHNYFCKRRGATSFNWLLLYSFKYYEINTKMLMFQECCFEIYLCFCVNLFPLIYFMGNQELEIEENEK